jgi:arylsulfatase A-like enzyme
MTRPRATSAALPAWALAWLVAGLLPTLAFKLVWLRTVTAGDLAVLASPGDSAWRLLLRLFSADVVAVAVVVGLAVVVRFALSEKIATALTWTVLAATLTAGGLGLLSLTQTGSLPGPDTWSAGWRWAADHPGVLPGALGWRGTGLAAILVLWLLAPPLLTRALEHPTSTRAGTTIAVLGPALLVAVAAVDLASGLRVAGNPGPPLAARTFWSLLAAPWAEGSTAGMAPPLAEVRRAIAELSWPEGRPAPADWLVDVPSAQRRPRHVVLITLETAPQRFYDLERADLPTFARMAARGVVADRHQTTAPMTSLAMFSLLTGAYPPASVRASVERLDRYPAIASESLPARLRATGYDTTFVDSYDLSWNGPDEWRILERLGFERIVDVRTTSTSRGPAETASEADSTFTAGAFERRLASEARSFALVRDRLIEAQARKRWAFITLATHLGHYDWPMPSAPGPAVANATPDREDPLRHVLRTLDRLFGGLLQAIEARGMAEDVILVVTGDHGLRFRLEFDALGTPFVHGDATFHVPLLIHAPGLLASQTRVPFVTSHVDVAPTLIDLLGLPRTEDAQDGGSLLDRRVAARLTLLPSGRYPGLRPADGLHWKGAYYTAYDMTGRVMFRREENAAEVPIETARNPALTAADIRARLATARRLLH